MDKQIFIEKLEKSYKHYFPHGYFNAKISTSFGINWTWFSLGLISEKKDCSNSIRENDPAYGTFKVTEDFTVDCITGHSLNCIPDVKYHAMSCRKIGFRKAKKKSFEEVLVYMDKYFQKMRKFVDDNKQDIYHVETYPKQYLISPSKLQQVMK